MGEKEKKAEHLKLRGPGRCPYCMDDIVDLSEVVACAACSARHHEMCFAEHGTCAGCGSNDVLVPRTKAPKRSERPPKGSTIEVEEREDETAVYSWPGLTTKTLALFLLIFVSCIVTIPAIPWYLLRYFRRKPSRLILEKDKLILETFDWLWRPKRIEATRDEVGAINLTRMGQNNHLRLSIDVGVDRVPVCTALGLPVLKEPELEWLHQVLLEWKEQ